MVDARLADGSRVNIVLPPLVLNGGTISIRKFPKHALTLDAMVRQHNLSPELAHLLQIAARSRLNILISGGTGSGKTTLLNAVSQHIDTTERIITIEDAVELRLQQPHVVQMETRPPNIEGAGHIPQRELVRNALRMRPDRIIVGEVRGPEAFDMLQAMNTGHDGSMTTVHANSPRDALYRVENMVMMANLSLPLRAIRMQVASALNLVVHIERMRDGVRRVQNVAEIAGMEGEIITARELFSSSISAKSATGRSTAASNRPACGPISSPAPRGTASTESCSTCSASGGAECSTQSSSPPLLTTVCSAGRFFGCCAPSAAGRISSRVLSTIAVGGLAALMRKSSRCGNGPQRDALPFCSRAALDFAFASTGDRIAAGCTSCVGNCRGCYYRSGLGSRRRSVPCSPPPSGGAAAAGAPALLLRFAQSRYQRKFLDIFPDALDLIVRAVRAGLPAPEAIELVTHEVRPPVATEFRQILDELRIGTEMEEALQRAADRIRVPDFRFFAVSLFLQRQTGGGIAETLSNLSSIIRQRKGLRMKARALTAEAKASAAIISASAVHRRSGPIPDQPRTDSVLFVDPRGRFLLGVAIASLLPGLAAMRALIKKNLR